MHDSTPRLTCRRAATFNLRAVCQRSSACRYPQPHQQARRAVDKTGVFCKSRFNMKKNLTTAALAAVLLVSLVSCKSTLEETGHELAGTRYTNNIIGLSFDVPSSWTVGLKENMLEDFQGTMEAVEAAGGELFLAGTREEVYGVQLLSEELGEYAWMTADDYAQAIVAGTGPAMSVQGFDSVLIGETPVARVLYIYFAGTVSFAHLDYIIVNRDQAIRLTFWTPQQLIGELQPVSTEFMKNARVF